MANSLSIQECRNDDEIFLVPHSSQITLSCAVPQKAQQQLVRMFRDPYVLDHSERTELIYELREAVSISPKMVDLYILLGMALCVDLQVQEAMEVFRDAVVIDPDNFLIHLKYGELLMRLRVCDQASEETRKAALLAINPIQSELARRQAATLRTMQREGIERGGYRGILSRITGLLTKRRLNNNSRAISAASLR